MLRPCKWCRRMRCVGELAGFAAICGGQFFTIRRVGGRFRMRLEAQVSAGRIRQSPPPTFEAQGKRLAAATTEDSDGKK